LIELLVPRADQVRRGRVVTLFSGAESNPA
jgi:hypothetical protein